MLQIFLKASIVEGINLFHVMFSCVVRRHTGFTLLMYSQTFVFTLYCFDFQIGGSLAKAP